VLPEGRRHADDVGLPGVDGGEDVLDAHPQLHVHEPHLTEQGGPGGAGQVRDGQREAGQREPLRVVQGDQQHAGAQQAVDGLRGQRGGRQPPAVVVDRDAPAGPLRPRSGGVGLPGQIRRGPTTEAGGPFGEQQAPVQAAGQAEPARQQRRQRGGQRHRVGHRNAAQRSGCVVVDRVADGVGDRVEQPAMRGDGGDGGGDGGRHRCDLPKG